MASRALIFVYNVDATPLALLRDAFQIVTQGSTDCRLCDISYSGLLKNPRWSAFIQELPIPVEFRLRSRFLRGYPQQADVTFPAAFIRDEAGQLQPFISAEEINAVPDLEGLCSLVMERAEAMEPELSAEASPA